jgi:hypothetical protein
MAGPTTICGINNYERVRGPGSLLASEMRVIDHGACDERDTDPVGRSRALRA